MYRVSLEPIVDKEENKYRYILWSWNISFVSSKPVF
jgi:hypothetical protein